MPISVSVGDTLKREPTHICDRNQAELIQKFVEELKRQHQKKGRRRLQTQRVFGDTQQPPHQNRRMVLASVGPGIQFWQLRPQRHQKPFRGASGRPGVCQSREQRGCQTSFDEIPSFAGFIHQGDKTSAA